MDMKRKKQLLWEYKNRKPEMGIIAFYCKPTKENYLGWSKDTKADINSNSFKLSAGGHPNRILQKLWKEYGEAHFEINVLEVLPYDEKGEKQDYSTDLEQLLNDCLIKVDGARRLKR